MKPVKRAICRCVTAAITFLLLSSTFFISVQAQIHVRSSPSFYPLAIGDYWEYDSYAWGSVGPWDTLIVEITRDSTFGGHTYQLKVNRSTHYGNTWQSYERADSSGDIFLGNPASGEEVLLYRLSDTSAGWWLAGDPYLHRFDSCTVTTVLGSPRATLYIGSYLPTDTTLYSQVVLVEGLGYYTTNFFGIIDGGGDFLRGARINGVIFGTIMAVRTSQDSAIPLDFDLGLPFPNPFNPSVTLVYSLPIGTRVEISVYDVLGRPVTTLVDQVQGAGRYTVRWDGTGASSGVYFCRMLAGNSVHTQKLMLSK